MVSSRGSFFEEARRHATHFVSGEDLDPLEFRGRERRPAFRAGLSIPGGPRVATRTRLADRPATMEQEADERRKSEEQYE
jgi:hypothetical protein